ncbi:MAG: hypothetical protein JKY37_23820 [Nannocystaceae bacterium]|nr:hypothetical protein [Nannocystaceae bacterium]
MSSLVWLRNRSAALCLSGLGVLISLGQGCSDDPDSNVGEDVGEDTSSTGGNTAASSDSETGELPAECAVLDSDANGASCGTYIESDEGCVAGTGGEETGDDGTGDGGTGDGGTESGAGDCDDEVANDAVVACVAQSASDGVAFTFGHSIYQGGGQYDLSISYRVAADGSMSRTEVGDDDLCEVDLASVHEAVDLSACDSWSCITSALGGATTIAACRDESDCDGV